MKTKLKPRNPYWDNVKFFTIASVVFFHFLLGIVDEEPLSKAIYIFIYSFHMPTFIFVSGLFLKYDKNHKLRFDKVIFYVLLAYILKLLVWAAENAVGNEQEWAWIATPNIPLYLIVTAEYIVFTYLIRKINPKIVLPVSIILSLAAGYFKIIGDYLCISKFIVFFPFFYAGYCLTPEKVQSIIKNRKVRIFAALAFIIIGICALLFTDEISLFRNFFSARVSYEDAGFPISGIFIRALQYVISTITAIGWCSFISTKNLRFFTVVGSRTLSVYFWHYFLAIAIMYIQLDKALINISVVFGIICLALISFIATCILSLKPFTYPLNFFSSIVSKIYNKIYNGLIKNIINKITN